MNDGMCQCKTTSHSSVFVYISLLYIKNEIKNTFVSVCLPEPCEGWVQKTNAHTKQTQKPKLQEQGRWLHGSSSCHESLRTRIQIL